MSRLERESAETEQTKSPESWPGLSAFAWTFPKATGHKHSLAPWKVLTMGTPRTFLVEYSEQRFREQKSALRARCPLGCF